MVLWSNSTMLAVFVFVNVVDGTAFYTSDGQRVLPFTLGLTLTDGSIDIKEFLGVLGETTSVNYRQVMLPPETSKVGKQQRISLLSLARSIRLRIHPVYIQGKGLNVVLKEMFCAPESRGISSVFFLVDDNITVHHNGVLLANFMTTIANYGGMPTIAWSSSPVIELEQVTKVELPTILLAPSVRLQAKAIYELLKQLLPDMRSGVLISLKATGYEIFVNELRRLVSRDAEGKRVSRFQFDSHLHHMSTRFIELVHLGNTSGIRENLVFLRDSSDVRVFVLYTEPEVTDRVLKEAHILGMLTSDYLWMAGRHAYIQSPLPIPRNYPPGFMTVTFNTSIEVQKLAIKAAIRIWIESVRRLVLSVAHDNDLTPSVSCTRFSPSKWKHGQRFHSILKRRMRKLLFDKYDSYGYSSMTEVQLVGFDITRQWRKLGVWTHRNGISVDDIEWLQRFNRNADTRVKDSDFLRIVTLDEPPYVIYSSPENGKCSKIAVPCRLIAWTEPDNEHTHFLGDGEISTFDRGNQTLVCCQGFVIDLIKRLSRDIGFRYEIFEVADRKWGSYDNFTGKWNGLIQAVLNGSADVVGTSLKINTDRAKAIDFSVPFYQTGITILVRVREGVVSSIAFLEPFSIATWVVVFVGCVNACALFIFGFENLNRNADAKLSKRSCLTQGKNASVLFESFWLVLSMLFNATMKSETPRSMSARFIVNIWAFFCVIFMSSFMANLAAFMITKEEFYDFSGIDDYRLTNPFSKNPPWKFGTIPFGATEHIIRMNFPDMYHYMNQYMRDDVDDGVDAVLHSKLDAFIYDASVLSYKAGRDKNCALRTVGKWYAPTGYGFGLTKGSKWIHDFNKQILEYQVKGYLQHLEDFWLSSSCKKHFRKDNHKSTELSVVHLSSLFGILLIAITCCGLFLIGDHYYTKRFSSSIHQNVTNLLLSPHVSKTRKESKKQRIVAVFRQSRHTSVKAACGNASCRVRHRLLQRQLDQSKQRIQELKLENQIVFRETIQGIRRRMSSVRPMSLAQFDSNASNDINHNYVIVND